MNHISRLIGTSAILRISIALLLVALALAYIGEASAASFDEVAKLTPSDGAASDNFGTSVSSSGDTVVVGTALAESAYVFERDNGGADNWGQVKNLTASDFVAGDRFGASVSISGNTIVVGARLHDAVGSDSGSAYVYERNEGGPDNWGQVKKLIATDGFTGDFFGVSVSISGNTIVVGAHRHDDFGAQSGSAYVFGRDTGGIGNWGEVKKITAIDAEQDDFFGESVSISGDTIVVGSHADDLAAVGNVNHGSAHVFDRDEGGLDNWGEIKKLSNPAPAFDDSFGAEVAISGDTIVVGLADDAAGTDSGAAYVFERDNGGLDNWGQVKKLTASDAVAFDQFGFAGNLTISGDTIVAGAAGHDDVASSTGAAYVFLRNEGGAGNWGQAQKLLASDAVAGDLFGSSVSISGDILAVGAAGVDGLGTNAGTAYVFGLAIVEPVFCAPGSYNPVTGAEPCLPAPAGSFVDTTGATAATQCSAGTFSDTAGASICTNADAGSFVAGTGATGQIQCAAGSYSDTSGAIICTLADAGSFVAGTGATGQTQCAAGSYSDTSGAIICTQADAGSFVAGTGAIGQTQCAAGSYSDTSGAIICTQADAGSFVAGSGATGQTQCAAGSYSDTPGAIICTQADAGSFVAGTGAIGQTQCAAGSYSDTSGAIICTQAGAGSFVAGTGAVGQTQCTAGSYSDTSGAIICTQADAGSFVAGSGATGQTECALGSFSTTAGAISCQLAPAGSFVDTTGATVATACPAGTSSPDPGATSVSDCLPIADTDGDGIPDTLDPDDDNDGIEDSIDTQPLVVSSRFDDTLLLGGKTSGLIVSQQFGVSVAITDATPNPGQGVTVVVSGTIGGKARIKIDGSKGVHKLIAPGTYVLSDPETTVTTQVILGTAEIVFDTFSPPILVVVGVGETATITETFVNGILQSITVVAVTGTITVDGVEVLEGDSLIVQLPAPDSPTEAITELADFVDTLGLPKGTQNSLVSKLDAAIKSLGKGKDKTAVNQINAFINHVQAQSGKKIDAGDADDLIAAAEAIIVAIEAGS